MSYIQTNAIVPISAATTLTPQDSGKIFIVTRGGVAYNISLPAIALSSGLTYKFINSNTTANAVRIVATAGTPVVGNSIILGGAPPASAISRNAATVSINFGAASVIGDEITLYCNGVNWFGAGFSGVAAGITYG